MARLTSLEDELAEEERTLASNLVYVEILALQKK